MKEVSIVTGTYNRLPYLKRMIASVRRSVYPLEYEIILVDGGSKDGTIGWCNQQRDVTLIEQGELLGAVRAFNAGAKAARGRYVILANDDIEFVDISILRAWTFMEDRRDVGIGCFYQDRDDKSWHVEQMPAISPGGIQTSVHYGQVCIIPRWLGTQVQWWGTYLHTYGGDNEMSCNVIELGYRVTPIECACIHDMKAEDELRIINKGDPRHVGAEMHPDSRKWLNKWTDGNSINSRVKVGPHIVFNPVISNPMTESRKRIVYVPIYEPGHTLQRNTKVGLRKALEKEAFVYEYDYIQYGIDDLFEVGCAVCPDLFIIQAQDANTFTKELIAELKHNHPGALFVIWNGDYHPENLYNQAYIELLKEVDYAGIAVAEVKERYQKEGINWFYWQIGYEESNAEPDRATKRHDVVFLGNGYSDARKDLGQFLLSLKDAKGLDVALYGIWPKGWSEGDNLYDFDSGRRIYRACRIAISDQQWPAAEGYVSNRLFQSMAAGRCLTLQQHFAGMEEYLGLKEDIHLGCWEDFDELEDQIMYFLSDEPVRRRIADAGHAYMLEHHSFDTRVKELMSVLGW